MIQALGNYSYVGIFFGVRFASACSPGAGPIVAGTPSLG